MKRSDALTPLSLDHHQGLVFAQRLRRATAESAAAARDDFLNFWEREGQRHFRAEEKVLLPWFARHGDPSEDTVLRVLVEHLEIRRQAIELRGDERPAPERLHELGELLGNHIRHEERVLFPLIEEVVPEHELPTLAAAVERAERED